MRRRFWTISALVLLTGMGLAAVFVTQTIRSRQAMPEALAALESDEVVRVSEGEWIVVAPAAGEPDTGLILYPGGFVDTRAYAPIARLIAARGFLVVLVEPPLATALLAVGEVSEIANAFPQIEHWAVGGHSLGGVAAAQAAHQNPGLVEGVLLMAAAPAQGDDLSDSGLAVLVFLGSADLVFPSGSVAWDLLPEDATIVEIEGGNHAQFGRYGDGTQSGDGQATIPREQQEGEVAEHTVLFLEMLGK